MARRILIMMIFRSNQIALEEIWFWEFKFGFEKLNSDFGKLSLDLGN
jgi:hypothetical protein